LQQFFDKVRFAAALQDSFQRPERFRVIEIGQSCLQIREQKSYNKNYIFSQPSQRK
jgi:hypothetical protein